jgi:hypothetical protein
MSVFPCLQISNKAAPSPKQCLITSSVLNFYGKYPKTKELSLYICPLLLNQFIHSCLPYLVAFSSTLIPRTRHALLTGTHALITNSLNEWTTVLSHVSSISYLTAANNYFIIIQEQSVHKNLTCFSLFLNNLFNDAMSFVQAIYPAVVGLMNRKNVKWSTFGLLWSKISQFVLQEQWNARKASVF